MRVAELLKMKNDCIEYVDGDRHDHRQQEHVAELRKMKLNDRAYVKENGIDLENLAKCVVDARRAKRRGGRNEKQRGRNASMYFFQYEQDRCQRRACCNGKTRASAARHDFAVGRFTALLRIQTVRDGSADENARTFTAERKSRKKAHKASYERTDKGREPAEL